METPFNSTADIGRSMDDSVAGTSMSSAPNSKEEPKQKEEENVASSSSSNKLTPQQQRLQQMIALQHAQQNQLQRQMQMSSMSRNPATGVTAPRRLGMDETHQNKNIHYHSYQEQIRPDNTVVIHHHDAQLNNEEVSGVTTSTMGEDDYPSAVREHFPHIHQHHQHPEHDFVDAGMHSMDFSSGRGKDNDYNRMIQRNYIPNYGATNDADPAADYTQTNTTTNNNDYNNNFNNTIQQPYMMMMSVEEQKPDTGYRNRDHLPLANDSTPNPPPHFASELKNTSQDQDYHQHFQNYQQQQQQQKPHQYQYHDAPAQYQYNGPYRPNSNDYADDPYAEFEAEYGYDCCKGGCCGSSSSEANDDSGNNSGLSECFSKFTQAENLHRSICFGAIDGMLTGSGIVAACCGLGWFSVQKSATATLALTALSLSACTSDGICMAIGHVWSNYVLTQTSIKERAEQRSKFDTHRSEAKAKLVDMLLMRGMLKIDAMSIADTLEGYPDIFVNAIVGDGVTQGISQCHSQQYSLRGVPSFSGHDNNFYGLNGGALGLARNNSYGDGGAGGGHHTHSDPDQHYSGHAHPPPQGILRSSSYTKSINTNMQPANTGFSSFGAANHHFWADDECEEDPDEAELNAAVMEGWYEGIFMMLAFCAFSILPSLIFTYVPLIFVSNQQKYSPYTHPYHNYYNDRYYSASTNAYSNIISVSILSVIMIMLGIWKSHFFQSSWIIFGIETVLVLYLSLGTAYLLGNILSVYVR